jgi:hypothetical protein
MPASVVALHRSRERRVPLEPLERAQLIEAAGLDGDRHSLPGNRRALLLVDQEVLEQFGLLPDSITLQPV